MTSPACPNCGAVVPNEAGFGMVMCEKCGQLVMIGGADAQAGSAESENAVVFTALSEAPPANNEASIDVSHEQPFESVTSDKAMAGSDSASDIDSDSVGETFKDVADFGNQDQPSTGFGNLVYDIKINGIDNVDIRKEVLEFLSDQRLQLDSKELLTQISQGQLVISQINPVKASVILMRLKHLPLKIVWHSHQLIKDTAGLALLVFFLTAFTFSVIGSSVHAADDLAKDEATLKNYATKISIAQSELQDLIAKKNTNHDATERDKILESIVKKNQDMQGYYQSFREQKEHILHEHPEQGDQTEHKYHHLKFKTLADLENESGLDGQLNRMKVKLDETYNEPRPMPGPTPTAKLK